MDDVSYTLKIPMRLHHELEAIASRDRIPLDRVMKRFFRLGLVVDAIVQSPTSHLVVHHKEKGDRILTMDGEDVEQVATGRTDGG